MKLELGSIFAGDYRVLRPLSEGGMGAVWVVEQLSTSKHRALKLMRAELLAEAGMRQRFEQEARIGARVASEHVVEVVAAGVADDVPYLVMELLEGELLSEAVARKPFSPSEALAVMKQLCHAVGAAHVAGIVHRDLKPENVFLARARRADSDFTVKVLDFGIAKLVAEGHPNDTAALGSPIWLAPEQTERAPVTSAADVWSLGLIAFYLLTGRWFWRALDDPQPKVAQVLREVVIEPIPKASVRASELGVTLPALFDGWFSRAVVRLPTARFSDASVAYEALVPVLGGTATPPTISAGSSVSALASAKTELASTPFASGHLFAGCKLEEKIGEGGTSSVWRATRDGETVVVKMLRATLADSTEWIGRIKREKEVLHAVAHPALVEPIATGTEGEQPYVIMRFIEGETLRQRIARGAMTPHAAWELLSPIAQGLAAAHEAGVVHRDVKPDNIIVGKTGPVLVDFGLAKVVDASLTKEDVVKLTQTGTPIGTPAYMPPEQWWNEGVGAASDQYAFAVTLYEVIKGVPPFEQKTYPALMQAHLHDAVPPLADPVADGFVRKALEKDKSARYASMRELSARGDVLLQTERSASSPVRRIAATAILLVLPLIWIFGVGYPNQSATELFRNAGWGGYPIFVAYVIAAILLLIGKRLRWMTLSPGVLGTFSTYTGWMAIIGALSKAPAHKQFVILHEGLYEANGGRFMGFALTGGLALSMVALAERPRSRNEAIERGAALFFGALAIALSVLTRMDAQIDHSWNLDLPRSDRALRIIAAMHDSQRTSVVIAVVLAIIGTSLLLIRTLPGKLEWPALLRKHAFLLAAVVLWAACDTAMLSRLSNASGEVYATVAPELEVFAQLDPPSASGDMPSPPIAPTLKLARDRIAIDATPVGLMSALESGSLDAVLLTDLSHKLAQPTPSDPPLLLMADRGTPGTTLLAALRIIRKTGVDRIGLLFTRGPAPVFKPGDPPEAAYALPEDFAMVRVVLKACPTSSDLDHWADTVRDHPSVCVAP